MKKSIANDVASSSEKADSTASKDNVIVSSTPLATGDAAIREFYGDSISGPYRMKSELVAQHLADIGMGK
jgi:hypothetical protein